MSYDAYRSRPRDSGSYDTRRRDDDRDYYHSRKAEQDSRSPPRRGRYYDQHQADSDQYASLYDDDVGDRPTTRRRVSVSPARSRGSGDEHDGRGYHRGRGGRGGRDGYGQSRRPNVESQTLILGNLPHDVEEQDILMGIDHISGDPRISTEQVQSVRLRSNKRGSRIAFLEFHQLSDATRFWDDYHPSVSFPLQHSRGVDSELVAVTIDYSRPRDDSDRHEAREDSQWECDNCGGMNYPHRAVCYKCRTERPDTMNSYPGYPGTCGPAILTGETDEDPKQTPSQFIVVRDLESSVTEELLAKGVEKLFREDAPKPSRDPSRPGNKLKSTAPTTSTATLGAAPGSLRRVFLVRDRRSNASWKYGFAEFATIDDARGAVAKFQALPRFTIASREVVVAFIHTGVFVPVLERGGEESDRFTFAPIYNPSVRVKYWDERAYPSTRIVNPGPEAAASSESAADATTTPSKPGSSTAAQDSAAKKKRDREALAAKIASKSLAMAPQMQMWAKKSAELHGGARKPGSDSTTDPSAQDAVASAESAAPTAPAEQSTDPVAPSWRDTYTSYADWDSLECLLCDGTFTSPDWLIYHETHAHAHFSRPDTATRAAALLSARGKTPRTMTRRVPRRKCDRPAPYTSFADQDALVCYLCMRRLPSVRALRRHETESELHRRKMGSEECVAGAKDGLAKAGWKPTKMVPLGYDGPVRTAETNKYRDRARERRRVYGQPVRPSATAPKRKVVAEEMVEEPASKKSKGAGLLAKMGWSAGEGLGASGEGRTEAVGADVYVPGVGLGAEGGKLGDAETEAARKTRGDGGGFVEKTRERARERFERLQ